MNTSKPVSALDDVQLEQLRVIAVVYAARPDSSGRRRRGRQHRFIVPTDKGLTLVELLRRGCVTANESEAAR